MTHLTIRDARRTGAALAVLALAALAHPRALDAQARPEVRAISLDEALRLGESTSETVRLARAGAERARGEQLRARSQLLPQLYGSFGYTRTLKSQFEVLQGGGPSGPPCVAYLPPGGDLDTRIDSLERALQNATNCVPAGGIDFSRVGFGARNQYQLGLSASQTLFSGFRVSSGVSATDAARSAADIELRAQRAQALLDITEAYYDAVLAGRLATIAESSLVQTEAVLRQATLARQVGNTSEFELLRARVTRDNQLPQLIERRAQRELAMLRLKQLLEVPLAAEVELTTDLQDSTAPAPTRVASLTGGAEPDTSAETRAAVRQADELVRAQQALLRSARGQRLPSISVNSQYGRVAYPNAGVPGWNDFTQNWTVGVTAQVPLFVGGRIRGDEMVARANLAEARARREQAREFAALDALSTITSLRQAEAAYSASAGTSEQAARAYSIAQLRYTEGISTQTELSEARLLLQQASANRAFAARNLQVARVRLALLKDLPLGAGGAAGQGTSPSAVPQQTQQPQQQLQGQQGQTADITQASQAGGFAP
jgi:outer membrane protein